MLLLGFQHEMDSWLNGQQIANNLAEAFDNRTVHKIIHLHIAGMTTKKSIPQSKANVFPKINNRAFLVTIPLC